MGKKKETDWLKIADQASDWLLLTGGVAWGLFGYNGLLLVDSIPVIGTYARLVYIAVGIGGIYKLLQRIGVLESPN